MPSGEIGLLWFDNDPKRTFEQKVQGAVAAFVKKVGRKCSCTCYVHQTCYQEVALPDVRVEALASVLRQHFWVVPDDQAVYTE